MRIGNLSDLSNMFGAASNHPEASKPSNASMAEQIIYNRLADNSRFPRPYGRGTG